MLSRSSNSGGARRLATDEDGKKDEDSRIRTLLAARDAVIARRMSQNDYRSSLKRSVKFMTSLHSPSFLYVSLSPLALFAPAI